MLVLLHQEMFSKYGKFIIIAYSFRKSISNNLANFIQNMNPHNIYINAYISVQQLTLTLLITINCYSAFINLMVLRCMFNGLPLFSHVFSFINCYENIVQ